MPIKPELRYFYPIDWPQVSRWVRFVRAKGRCEACGRPHGQLVRHLGDGRWWDEVRQTWRDGRGRKIPFPARPSSSRCGRLRWCWRQPTSTMIRRTAGDGTATSRHSASGATCSTTARSIGGGSGSRCAGAGPWATCSRVSIRLDWQPYDCRQSLSHRHPPSNPLPCGEASQPSAVEVSLWWRVPQDYSRGG